MPASLFRPLVFALLLLTTACVPIVLYDEYLPEMVGGTVKSSNCLDAKSVGFDARGVAFNAAVYRPWRKPHEFSLGMAVADGMTVELLDPFVMVAMPSSAAPKRVAIPKIEHQEHLQFGSPRQSFPTLAPIVGRDIVRNTHRRPAYFRLSIPLEDFESGDVRITLPPLKINGSAVDIAPIIFKKYTRIHVMAPLNC